MSKQMTKTAAARLVDEMESATGRQIKDVLTGMRPQDVATIDITLLQLYLQDGAEGRRGLLTELRFGADAAPSYDVLIADQQLMATYRTGGLLLAYIPRDLFPSDMMDDDVLTYPIHGMRLVYLTLDGLEYVQTVSVEHSPVVAGFDRGTLGSHISTAVEWLRGLVEQDAQETPNYHEKLRLLDAITEALPNISQDDNLGRAMRYLTIVAELQELRLGDVLEQSTGDARLLRTARARRG